MSKSPLKIIFMGTPEFAVPGLKALLNSQDFSVTAIVTQEDKPQGRKQEIKYPPVKQVALENNIPVFQPHRVKEIENELKKLAPDLIVVIAYGQIIPETILDIPKYDCVNVHGSLLPKYRGAACLQAPILNGDSETGLTIMMMEAGLDTGPILRQTKITMTGYETLEELHDRLANLAAEILPPALLDFIEGKIIPQKQDNSQASYVKTIKKEDGHIDWKNKAQVIERQVRAFTPWPGAFSLTEDNKMLKIVTVSPEFFPKEDKAVGEIFGNNQNLLIAADDQALKVESLQLAGGKILKAQEFISGHQNFLGKILK